MSNQELQVIQEQGDDFIRSIALYNNASNLVLDEATEAKLTAPIDANNIEIRPDGLIYLPQVFWRQILNNAFGIGQWCLIVKQQTKDPNISKLYVEGVLMVRGSYVATAVGEAEYHDTNSNQSWASVWESAKSDCITRCCKDLGIANELWQPQFNRKWISENAVKVFVEKTPGNKKVQWRHKDAAPFFKECGYVPDSPNKPNGSSQTTAAPAGETKPEDNRPWLSESQYKQAIERISKGEKGVVDNVLNAFKVKKEYRAGLSEAAKLLAA